MRIIDADAIKLEKGFFEKVDNVPKFYEWLGKQPTVDAVPVDFINQKIVELQSCANQHFNDGNEILATCVWETMRLIGGFVKEWRGKVKVDADS